MTRWIFFSVCLVACSTASPSAQGPAAVAPVDAASCAVTPLDAPTTTQAFHALSATIVAPSGAALPDAAVTVCGFDVCLIGKVDAAGAATVTNASGSPMTRPAFKIGDGRTLAELAYPLDDHADFTLGKTVAIPLPDFGAGVALVAGQSATMGDVTMTIAPGAALTFDALLYGKEERGLRVAPIALDHAPLAIDPSARIELAYALAPQGTTFCPPAALDVANVPGWPAGSAVEVLVHGIDLAQRWAPYAGWAVVAPARVTDDARRIRTEAGAGLPVLGAIGLRRK
jgi:hypothetical protein